MSYLFPSSMLEHMFNNLMSLSNPWMRCLWIILGCGALDFPRTSAVVDVGYEAAGDFSLSGGDNGLIVVIRFMDTYMVGWEFFW